MSAYLEPDFLCSWATGMFDGPGNEFANAQPEGEALLVAPTDPIPNQGNYALQQGGVLTNDGHDGQTRFLVQGNPRYSRSMGFLWRPIIPVNGGDTNGHTYCANIAGFRGSTGLLGAGVGWEAIENGDPGELCIYNLNGYNEYLSGWTPAVNTWYWISFKLQLKVPLGSYICRAEAMVHRCDVVGGVLSLVKEVEWSQEFNCGCEDVNAISWGQLYASTMCSWQMTNLYVCGNVSDSIWWAPLCPTFVSAIPDGTDTGANRNTTYWTKSDGNDDYANECAAIDETPASDTDYIKKTNGTVSGLQYYGPASGLVPAGQNVLCVAAIYRAKRTGAGTSNYRMRLRMKGTTTPTASRSSTQTQTVFGYEDHSIVARYKPGTTDEWAPGDVDNFEPGANVDFVGAGVESDLSHYLMYAVYGDDYVYSPSTGDIKKLLGVDWANVKKYMGMTAASIKKINGVATGN